MRPDAFDPAEESAIVLGQEPNGDSVRQKFRQTVITLFDTHVMVLGSNQDDNELSNWEEISPGNHSYPFALKVPNVNFPPCIPSLPGFSIRYVWTAQVEGPFETSLSTEEVLCQFLPNVLAPKPMEWTFHDVIGATVSKNSTHQLHKPLPGIALDIRMHQQVYVPGDPLSMATTLYNHSQNKVVGLDIILRQTVKGTFPTTYANLSNQAQVEIMAKSVECKIRPGETGKVDILTTIPPMGKTYSIPTFESNFLKVYYELLCVIRVKRSVFSGGDMSHQCAIPVPLATHNVDNPVITGRTPRWTKSRMQPYFFNPTWPDPMGDIPRSLANEVATLAHNTSHPRTESPLGVSSLASASAASLIISSGVNPNAMQEFLNSGSVELYRERTLKKSLTRSKSMKEVQSTRLDGSSWRAERDQLLSQSRESGANDTPASSGNNTRRSPPLDSKTRSSSDDGQGATSPDTNGYVSYTPPPPASIRPQKSINLTPEQQAELARKASRRILPNQALYTYDGDQPELAQSESHHQASALASSHSGHSNSDSSNNIGSDSGNAATYPIPISSNQTSYSSNSTIKPLPRRNASLSQKAHQQQGSSNSNGGLYAEPESYEVPPRGGNSNNTPYESSHIRGRSNNGSSDQVGYQGGQTAHPLGPTPERMPYQHSLPAHQQPPGVVPPAISSSIAYVGGSQNTPNTPLERTSSRRDGIVAGDNLPIPPPTTSSLSANSNLVNRSNSPTPVSASADDISRHHRRSGSSSSDNGAVNTTVSLRSSKIPPWERVERVHHQDWFRPGTHQTGALQVFDVAGITLSHMLAVPILKKSLQRPMEAVQSIEAEEYLN
ncbi:hypothetical protein BGZ98_007374 [Dissophora globulifera]|nr:hypothetical protein BGZ98_007374 [Dissophora globulifera]